MTTLLRLFLSVISLATFLLFAPSALAQEYKITSPNAEALAAELHSGDTYRIGQALDRFPYYEDVYEDNSVLVDIHPSVAKGLISALDTQLDYLFSENIGEGGEVLFEYVITPLTVFLTRIDDREAIPVLLRASQFGGAAPLALAEFGPDIVPVVIDYINSPERNIAEIGGGFLVCASIVRFWRPLDLKTHDTLKQLAINYMQGYVPEHLVDDPLYSSLKRDGAYLASALGDADLKEMVIGMMDDLKGFGELYLEQWYEEEIDAIDSDRLEQND